MNTIKKNNKKEDFWPGGCPPHKLQNRYRQGYNKGKNDGRSAGYSSGKRDGYGTGKNDGYVSGKKAGEGVGYSRGRNSRNGEIATLKTQRTSAINARDNMNRKYKDQYNLSKNLKTAVDKLGNVGQWTSAVRAYHLYSGFFGLSEKSLKYNSDLVLNQQDLLSKQREIKSIKKNRAQTINKDYQNLMSGLTMNDRVMDYDLYDSGSNKKINRLLYIITLILIVATVALIFLRKFSML